MIYLTPRAQTWGVPPIWEGGIPYLMFVQVSVPYIFPIAGFLRWLKCKLTVDHMTYAWAEHIHPLGPWLDARPRAHVGVPLRPKINDQRLDAAGK